MTIARALTWNLVVFLLFIGGAALVCTVTLTFAVSLWADIKISGWNIVAAQISRWLAFGLGLYLIHNMLPVAVAHGRTRREFLWQAGLFTALSSLVLAVLARAGFAVETVLYDWMDWTRDQTGNGILEYWLMFAVWHAVGAFVTAAFDRYQVGGLLAIPIGFALIIPVGALVSGSNSLPVLGTMPGYSFGQATLYAAGTYLIGLALAWVIAREMPIRTKAA